MDYGAKGDGMMDDSAAIQAAIQAAKAAGGGAVIFPPGQYVVTSRLLVDADNIVLRGSGIGTSTLFFPKPLAQVDAVPPPELPPNEDNVISPYSWHEGFITIGTGDMSTQPGFVLLATVMNDAPRGATQLQVDSPGNVTVGDYVMVTMSSPPGSSAVSASLYSNMTTAAEIAGLQGLQYAWRFPSRCVHSQVPGSFLCYYCKALWPQAICKHKGSFMYSILQCRVVAVGDTYIELERQLPVDIYAAWTAQIRAFVPTVQQSGIEDLTINFAWTHSNPHLHEVSPIIDQRPHSGHYLVSSFVRCCPT